MTRHSHHRSAPLHHPRKTWMYVVAVLVVAAAGGGVYRLHSVFGSDDDTSTPRQIATDDSFNPKRITLQVFGDPGSTATINYLDIDAQPQKVMNAPLPWSLEFTTTQPGAFTNLVAQGNSSSLGCRITVDGEIKDERTVDTVNAYTFCLAKSA